jgi:hypothetical protein
MREGTRSARPLTFAYSADAHLIGEVERSKGTEVVVKFSTKNLEHGGDD